MRTIISTAALIPPLPGCALHWPHCEDIARPRQPGEMGAETSETAHKRLRGDNGVARVKKQNFVRVSPFLSRSRGPEAEESHEFHRAHLKELVLS